MQTTIHIFKMGNREVRVNVQVIDDRAHVALGLSAPLTVAQADEFEKWFRAIFDELRGKHVMFVAEYQNRICWVDRLHKSANR